MRGFSGDLVLLQELINAEINAKTVFHQCQSVDGEGQTAKRHRRPSLLTPARTRPSAVMYCLGKEFICLGEKKAGETWIRV